VFGWSSGAREALRALEATGAYAGVAVADPSGGALVQARTETGLACHQQAWTFLQRGDYDTVLVAREGADEAIRVVRDRGAQVIVLADACDLSAIAALAERSISADGSAHLLQPILHEAGFEQLEQMLTEAPGRTPRTLDITIEAGGDPLQLMSSAVAQCVTLTPDAAATITVERWGDPARAVHVSVDSAEWQARLTARHAPMPYMRIVGESEGLAFEWRITQDGPFFARTDAGGTQISHVPTPVAPWMAEAQRIASQPTDDRARIRRQAVMLDGVVRAAVTGEPQRTACCAPKLTALTPGIAIEGSQPTMEARRERVTAARPPHLRLVTS